MLERTHIPLLAKNITVLHWTKANQKLTCISQTFNFWARFVYPPSIPYFCTSKRPEILGRLDVRLNVLKFQEAIFTFPRTFRRTKIWNTWWINKSCPEIRYLKKFVKYMLVFW